MPLTLCSLLLCACARSARTPSLKSIRKPRVIESSRRRRWLIACPTSGRQATILSIPGPDRDCPVWSIAQRSRARAGLLILSKNLRVLGVFAVQIAFRPSVFTLYFQRVIVNLYIDERPPVACTPGRPHEHPQQGRRWNSFSLQPKKVCHSESMSTENPKKV